MFEFIGAENVQTTLGLLSRETLIVTLEELEDILDNDCLEVDLFFVIEVVSLQFDLRGIRVSVRRSGEKMDQVVPLTYPHWHLEGRRSGPEIDAHIAI